MFLRCPACTLLMRHEAVLRWLVVGSGSSFTWAITQGFSVEFLMLAGGMHSVT